MIGLSFGSVASSSLGLFMEPLQHEFGWSRAQIGFGLTISAMIGTPISPFAGALIDRFGPRMNAIPGLILAGIGFAGFALIGKDYIWWIAAWLTYSLLSSLIKTGVWTTAVSATFVTGRGMALAAVLGGLGLAQSLVPIVTHALISNIGWRWAFAALGLGWSGVALVLVVLFLHDPLSRKKAAPQAASGYMPGGLTLREAVRSGPLLRISFAIFLQAVAGTAAIVHLVPILNSMGVSRGEAASMGILMGAGSMIGKLLSGWLADKRPGDLVNCSCFALPALGYLLLWYGNSGFLELAAGTFFIGYGMGAGFQMTGYLFTHYAGLRHFGKIFGLLGSATGLGAGLGPPIAGRIFDVTGGYSLFLVLGIAQGILSGLSVFRLGPYPRFQPATA